MKSMLPRGFVLFLLSLLVYLPSLQAQPDEQCNVLFLAGRPSHGYGAHEHYAGCQLLAKSLDEAMDNVTTEVIRTKWPSEVELANADVIVMYSDGGGGHPVNKHLEQIDRLAKSGVGIVCIHYAVEVPKGKSGEKFLDWIGGYFETDWSVNPHWRAEFTELPDHPVTRGVNPFSSQDEWYYHMRFRDNMQGVTPILSAIPPESTLSRPDGPHSGNPHVRAKAGQPQHVAWATEREDGGRGFGFTGGHFHWNWGDDDFRRLMLNAIVWTAKLEVPENGVPIENVNLAALKDNQDFDEPKKLDVEKIRKVHGIDSK
ncbi:MAG: ThuA domain-containing protein [Planctomycetaceae bacterium]|nr:ThuA domain-containing protein [Planctomycetaceae bacterium]